MAEETKEETQKETQLNEEKLAELIKTNVNASMTELLAKQTSDSYVGPKTEAKTQDKDEFWDNILDPKINTKLDATNLRADLAQDKVDFYTSDDWLVEADAWLVEEDPEKRKAEKNALRKQVEDYSARLVKLGKPLPRSDIFDKVLGEKIKKDRVKFEEGIGKRNKVKEENELAQARRGVDISTSMVDFSADAVHSMSWDKVTETYGGLNF